MSVSVFDKIGIVPASASLDAAVIGLQGVGDTRATFGLLQSFVIDSKVFAQIKRTLRQTPVIFPMGDDLSEIALSFMAPMQTPCADSGLKSNLSAAIAAYADNRVRPDLVKAVTMTVSDVRYSCLILGMRAEGSLQGSSQVVSVVMRMVGVKVR